MGFQILSAVMSRQGGLNGQSHHQHLVDRWGLRIQVLYPKGKKHGQASKGPSEGMWAGLAQCSEGQDKTGKLDRLMTECEVEVHGGVHIGALVPSLGVPSHSLRWLPMGVSA